MQKTTRSVLGLFAAAVLGACTAAGCSADSSSKEDAPKSDAVASFEQATGTEWILEMHPTYKTVRFAFPRAGSVALPPGDAKDAVLALLDQHKAVFGMTDPKSEWRFVRESTDETGQRNIRFSQYGDNGNAFVDGAEWLASIDPDGKLGSMIGTYVPNLAKASSAAKIAIPDAEAAAAADAVARYGVDPSAVKVKAGVDRAFFHIDGTSAAVLAYEVDVAVNDVQPMTFVDANSGAVLTSFDPRSTGILTYPYGDATTGHGYGSSHYAPYNMSGVPMVAFPTTAAPTAGQFWLSGDSATGVHVWTTRGDRWGTAVSGGPKDAWVSPLPAGNTTPQGADVDAQATFAKVVDAYKRTFNRSSYNNGGGEIQILMGQNGSGAFNAFWQPSQGFLNKFVEVMQGNTCGGTFGIGDGNATALPMGVSFDIIGHEFTHAVSGCAWGGSTTWNAAAVNEAMSDIMSAFLTGSTTGSEPRVMGTGIYVGNPNGYLRNLANPLDAAQVGGVGCSTLQDVGTCADATTDSGAHYQEPHAASQIISYAWELMTYGGKHVKTNVNVPCPMGFQKSMELWNWIEHHEMPRSPDFRQVANTSLSAAQKKKMSLIPVACAWQAVGVITADEAKNTWNVDCAKGGTADAGAAPDGGGNSLLTPSSGAAPLLCTGATSLLRTR